MAEDRNNEGHIQGLVVLSHQPPQPGPPDKAHEFHADRGPKIVAHSRLIFMVAGRIPTMDKGP